MPSHATRHVKYVAGRKVDLGPSEVLFAGSLKLVVGDQIHGDPLHFSRGKLTGTRKPTKND